jgi:O-acetyl-ADP-ribose deacetylase (regulator of RNase III)
LWRSPEWSVRESVRNAMKLAVSRSYRPLAFPLIGAGSGGRKGEPVYRWMREELQSIPFDGFVVVVRYEPA